MRDVEIGRLRDAASAAHAAGRDADGVAWDHLATALVARRAYDGDEERRALSACEAALARSEAADATLAGEAALARGRDRALGDAEVRAAFDRARALLAGSPRALAPTLALAHHLFRRERKDEAVAVTELAARSASAPWELAECWILRARSHEAGRRPEALAQAAEEALAHAREAGDGPLIARALCVVAGADQGAGRFDAALERIAEGRTLAARFGLARQEAELAQSECAIAHQLGDLERTLALARRLREMRGANPVMLTAAFTLEGLALRTLGRADEAIAAFTRAREASADLLTQVASDVNVAMALLDTGEAARAREHLDRAQQLAPAVGAGLVAEVHAVAYLAAERQGDGAAAARQLDALETAGATGTYPEADGMEAVVDGADLAARSGELGRASRALGWAFGAPGRSPTLIDRVEAALRALAGRGGPTLGRWQLDGRLGSGAMGEVWSARSPTGQRVAVKVLGAAASAAVHRTLFQGEVRAAARLVHPGIALVLGHGTAGAAAELLTGGRVALGSPWLAMELVEGAPLGTGPLGWERCSDLADQVLDALGHAHARGVLHRDIKPANVLVTRDGRARLVDFGLAAAFGDSGGPLRVAGSPSYMAPEQARGDWREAGPWTDLYAVGMMLAELVQGAAPFVDGSAQAIVRAQIHEPVPPIRPRFPVPADLGRWLARALAKDPPERYASAAAAREALRSLGPPVVMAEVRVEEPLPRPPGATPGRMPREPDVDLRSPTSAEVFALRTPPVVGRARERAALWDALGRTVRTGRPQVVVVHGPEGVGCSRLLEWLCTSAEEAGVAWPLRVRHGSDGRPGFQAALLERIRAVGLDGDALSRRIGRALAVLGASPEVADDVARGRGPDAAAAFVRAAAGAVPVVLAVDDAQWGREALGAAASVVATEAPVLVVVAHADDVPAGPEAGARLRALGRDATDLPIGPLPAFDQRRLVDRLVRLDDETAARLAEQTSGSPGLAVEILSSWVREGALVATPHGHSVRSHGGSSGDPGRDRAVRALRTAGPDGAEALLLAAMLGVEVDAARWASAADRAGVARPEDLPERLVASGLWTARPDGWAFASRAVRASLLERVAQRREADAWHAACAEVVRDRPVDRAEHQLAAGEARAALDLLVDAAEEHVLAPVDVARRWVDACRAALLIVAPPEDDERRAWLAVVEGHVGVDGRDHALEERKAARAVEEARRRGWSRPLAHLLRQQAILLRNLDRRAEAAERFEEAARGFDASGASSWRIRCELGWAKIGHDPTEATRVLRRIGSDPDAPVRTRADAWESLAALLVNTKRAAEARECARQAIALHDPAETGRALVMDGAALRVLGDLGGSERTLREAIARLSAEGGRAVLAAECLLGVVLLQRGEAADAARTARRVLATRVHPEEAFLLLACATVGDPDDADWEEAFTHAGRAPPDPDLDDALAAGIALAVRAGREDRRQRLAALLAAREFGTTPSEGEFHLAPTSSGMVSRE